VNKKCRYLVGYLFCGIFFSKSDYVELDRDVKDLEENNRCSTMVLFQKLHGGRNQEIVMILYCG
jgi:hypothetical protein